MRHHSLVYFANKNPTLAITFGGLRLKPNTVFDSGNVYVEFYNTMQSLWHENITFDLLSIADLTNSWYQKNPEDNTWSGYNYYLDVLKQYTKPYKKVVMIGSSMGGTGALLYRYLHKSY